MKICLYSMAALLLFVPPVIQAAGGELLCNGMTFSEAKQQFEMDLSPHVRSANLPALVRFGMHGKAEEVLDLLLKQYPELVFGQKNIDACLVSAIAEGTATEQLPVFLSLEERDLNQRLILSLLRVGAAHPDQLALATADENRAEGERALARAIAGYLNEFQQPTSNAVEAVPSATPATATTIVDSKTSGPSEPTKFRGRTLEKWLHQFSTSLEVKERLACLPAFHAFSRTDHLEQIARVVFSDLGNYPAGWHEMALGYKALTSGDPVPAHMSDEYIAQAYFTLEEAELLVQEWLLISRNLHRIPPRAVQHVLLTVPVGSVGWELGLGLDGQYSLRHHWAVQRFMAEAKEHGEVPPGLMVAVLGIFRDDSRKSLPDPYVELLKGESMPISVMQQLALQLKPYVRPTSKTQRKTDEISEQAYRLLGSYFDRLNTPEANDFFQKHFQPEEADSQRPSIQ